MRDFPIFSTESGVSSLTLKEIPYKKQAYIQVQDVQPGALQEHLRECVQFCKAAGAEYIFAAGHPELEHFPLHTAIWKMQITAWVDLQKLENLFPVTEATAESWREVYNRQMAEVDNTATLEARDVSKLYTGAYFVHHRGEVLGIGWLKDTTLLAVAAVKPGAGERVMHTLMSLVEGARMELEVASTNTRAVRLYEKLGFLKTGERSRWYRVDSLLG